MTPDDFKAWRAKMRLTQTAAAAALDLSEATIQLYERGIRPNGQPAPIPLAVALACSALYHRLEPWGSAGERAPAIHYEIGFPAPSSGAPRFSQCFQIFALYPDGRREPVDDTLYPNEAEAQRRLAALRRK